MPWDGYIRQTLGCAAARYFKLPKRNAYVRVSLIGRNLSLGCRRAPGARETVSLGPGCLSLLIFSR